VRPPPSRSLSCFVALKLGTAAETQHQLLVPLLIMAALAALLATQYWMLQSPDGFMHSLVSASSWSRGRP
jgi:hypothetical protein